MIRPLYRQITVEIPADLLEICCNRIQQELIRLDCGRGVEREFKKTTGVTFMLDQIAPDIWRNLMNALANAPLDKIDVDAPDVVTTPTDPDFNSRSKNRRALNRFKRAGLKDYKEVIRGIGSGASHAVYRGSFFGDDGTQKGCLFHAFDQVPDELGHIEGPSALYVKFIAPSGALGTDKNGNRVTETDIYHMVRRGKDPKTKTKLTVSGNPVNIRADDVMPGGTEWEVVSFHSGSDGKWQGHVRDEWDKLHPKPNKKST